MANHVLKPERVVPKPTLWADYAVVCPCPYLGSSVTCGSLIHNKGIWELTYLVSFAHSWQHFLYSALIIQIHDINYTISYIVLACVSMLWNFNFLIKTSLGQWELSIASLEGISFPHHWFLSTMINLSHILSSKLRHLEL